MNREYHHWHSHHLERRMELLIFGHAGARVLVFPTRCGRYYDYENFGLVEAIQPKIAAGHLQLFCVDSIDSESFYCAWAHPMGRIARHSAYERYILDEVLPFAWARNPTHFTIAHGCSMGAYHAVNLALRHPQYIHRVLALSGRYDLTASVGSYRSLFDDFYSEDIYFNTPCHFLPNLSDPAILAHLRAVRFDLAIGDRDVFFENNRQLSHILDQQAIPNHLYIWHGEAHKPRHWAKMIQLYL